MQRSVHACGRACGHQIGRRSVAGIWATIVWLHTNTLYRQLTCQSDKPLPSSANDAVPLQIGLVRMPGKVAHTRFQDIIGASYIKRLIMTSYVREVNKEAVQAANTHWHTAGVPQLCTGITA